MIIYFFKILSVSNQKKSHITNSDYERTDLVISSFWLVSVPHLFDSVSRDDHREGLPTGKATAKHMSSRLHGLQVSSRALNDQLL